ncbi:MAG: HAD hydrolase-like protein [Firmicutes bacterium]|nr:HAD hydrolase-like protein [Bacillota bacterium]
MYKYILFDLDGTLVDTGEGIMLSVRQTVEDMGLEKLSEETVRSFIGPPLKAAFMEKCGLDDEKAGEAVKIFRAHYSRENILLCSLYKGIPELCEKLIKSGKTLIVATSKPTPFAKRVLENLGIDKYFADIVGSELDNSRTKKCEVIEYIIEKFCIKDRNTVVMVGDKAQDIIGAKQCGVKSVGVLFGYGSFEELSAENADYIIKTPDEAAFLSE